MSTSPTFQIGLRKVSEQNQQKYFTCQGKWFFY